MIITPAQLVDQPLQLDENLPAGDMEYSPDVRQIGPLSVKGEASLIVEHRGPKEFVDDIRLRAHFEGRFEVLCARCIDPVEQDLKGNFDLIFRPGGVDNEPGEHAITEDETEIGYYEESGLLLEDAVREQVLLALPGRTLCRQDCKGLCPQCGANRNVTPCNCEERPVDMRWNALAGLAVPKS
jgi:uncharacterized protein